MVLANAKAVAAALFQVAIAHDKGKPVARQRRKAVSLPQWRLSGCRRRSEKEVTLKSSDYVQLPPNQGSLTGFIVAPEFSISDPP